MATTVSLKFTAAGGFLGVKGRLPGVSPSSEISATCPHWSLKPDQAWKGELGIDIQHSRHPVPQVLTSYLSPSSTCPDFSLIPLVYLPVLPGLFGSVGMDVVAPTCPEVVCTVKCFFATAIKQPLQASYRVIPYRDGDINWLVNANLKWWWSTLYK